jgi:Putative Actinobacterial Holin-X, holin superfamily III
MPNAYSGSSTIELVKELASDIKTLVREEMQLAKTEVSEKISYFSRNSVTLVIGGFVAYAGVIVLLGGLGVLLAFALESAGLSPALAEFIGLAVVGLLVAAVGAVLVLKGLKAFSKESLAPKKTIETIQHLKGTDVQPVVAPEEPKDERSSGEIKADVMATEDQMGEKLSELGDRLTLRHLRRQANQQIRSHPYRWGFVAMLGGLVSSVLVQRKWLHGRG